MRLSERRATNIGLLYNEITNNIGRIFPLTSPNQNIGDVSQASPVGLTPVLLRPFTFPPFAFHFLLPMQCISSRSSSPLLASHFSHFSYLLVAYILSCFFLVPFHFRPWKGWGEYMACCGYCSALLCFAGNLTHKVENNGNRVVFSKVRDARLRFITFPDTMYAGAITNQN